MSRLKESGALAILGMDVILLEEFIPLGRVGDVVTVRAGFARDVLLPRNMALRADAANRKIFEADRARIEAEDAVRRRNARRAAKKLEGKSFTLIRPASNTGQLDGTLALEDVVEALHAAGHSITALSIAMDRPIREIGLYGVRVMLHPEVVATIQANVARTPAEAIQQDNGVDVLATIRDGYKSDEGEEWFGSRDEVVAALTAEFATLISDFPEQRFDRLGDLLEKARSVVQEPSVVTGQGLGLLVDIAAGRAAIDAIATDDLSTDWAQSDLLGAPEMAKELAISPATLANWRRDGHVLAFKRDRRNYSYPQRQVHRGTLIEGLGKVARHFDQVEDAWEWLVTPNVHTQGLPPIDRLRLGAREEVEHAAEGAFDVA